MIKKLRLKNYRNFENLELSFPEGITVIYGDNGRGKTNILESIHFLTTSKSPLTSREQELIKWEREYTRAYGEFDNIEVEIILSRGRKKIKVNGRETQSARLASTLSSVFFHPRDIELLDEPVWRRRYINLIISRINQRYSSSLRLYYRILRHRNKVIRRLSEGMRDDIDIWDERLSREGEFIIKERERILSELSKIFEEIFGRISGRRGNIRYIRTCEDMRSSLKRNLERDMKYLSTTTGPHRDDLEILMEGKRVVSRGEKRLLSLSLKLSEAVFLKNKGKEPILLLDDIFSELDEGRKGTLLENLPPLRQLIITTQDIFKVPRADFTIGL